MQHVLERASYEVAGSVNAVSGMAILAPFKPDVVVIDLHLSDTSGLELLRWVRQREPRSRCIFITRFGHDWDRDEAIRLGAFDCIEQPLTPGLLVAVVHSAESRGAAVPERDGSEASHALARWTDVVVRGVRSPKDMRTLNDWGRAVAVSKGGIRNWCYTACLSPRRSLQFMRVLRAVIKQYGSTSSAEDLLDIVDRRTLAKLLTLAGGTSKELPTNVDHFLDRQQILQNTKAMASVRAALRGGGDLPLDQTHTSSIYDGPDRRHLERRQRASADARSQSDTHAVAAQPTLPKETRVAGSCLESGVRSGAGYFNSRRLKLA
jgi:two-component system chemotaxis response regulator CheY